MSRSHSVATKQPFPSRSWVMWFGCENAKSPQGPREGDTRLPPTPGRPGVHEVTASAWYDAAFLATFGYRLPYWQSDYYFAWSVIGDRPARSGKARALEVGCGTAVGPVIGRMGALSPTRVSTSVRSRLRSHGSRSRKRPFWWQMQGPLDYLSRSITTGLFVPRSWNTLVPTSMS